MPGPGDGPDAAEAGDPSERGAMIVRTWRGATRAEHADEYLEYLRRTGVSEYAATPGNRGVLVLRRSDGERAEFLLISFWASSESVAAFAGPEPERAVFYPEDDRYLVDRDLGVAHFDLVDRVEDPEGDRGR
ncbi:MAG: antibiotic biosynthesis monooxygenase family protein [Gemmatimonadota bacterium]